MNIYLFIEAQKTGPREGYRAEAVIHAYRHRCSPSVNVPSLSALPRS